MEDYKKDKTLEVFYLFISMKKNLGLIRNFHKFKTHNDLEGSIVLFLKFNKKASQAMIKEKMKIPKQTISNSISNLEKNGYVEAIANEKDKRQKLLILTKKGEKMASELYKPISKFHQDLIDEMSYEKIEQMKDDMKQLSLAIEKITRGLDG